MKSILVLAILLSLLLQSMTAVIASPALPAGEAARDAEAWMTEASDGSVKPCHEQPGRAGEARTAGAVVHDDLQREQHHDHCVDLCLLGVCCAAAPELPASQSLSWAPAKVLGAADGQPALAVTDEPFRPPISTLS